MKKINSRCAVTNVINSIYVLLLMLLLPAQAFAAEGDGNDGLMSLVPLVIIMFIFYFLLIKPQQKRIKKHESMVNLLKKGDKVVTAGGIYGVIFDVDADTGIARIDIADAVRIKVKQDTITALID
ncbi:MAG: preprotein translocase subunit YajC [Mariprofundales bacterium]